MTKRKKTDIINFTVVIYRTALNNSLCCHKSFILWYCTLKFTD